MTFFRAAPSEAVDAKPAVSDTEKAESAAAPPPAEPSRDEKFVRYVGAQYAALTPADVGDDREALARIVHAGTYRSISPAEWRQVGAHAAHPSVWSRQNGYRVPVSQLNKRQLDYLLDEDGDFDLVDGSGNKTSR